MKKLADHYKKHTHKKTKRLLHSFFFHTNGRCRDIIREKIKEPTVEKFFEIFLPYEINYDIENDNYPIVEEWLGENCHGAWMPFIKTIGFTDKCDAALFKLFFVTHD